MRSSVSPKQSQHQRPFYGVSWIINRFIIVLFPLFCIIHHDSLIFLDQIVTNTCVLTLLTRVFELNDLLSELKILTHSREFIVGFRGLIGLKGQKGHLFSPLFYHEAQVESHV